VVNLKKIKIPMHDDGMLNSMAVDEVVLL